MKKYSPTVIHIGTNEKAFRVLLGRGCKLEKVQFKHIRSIRRLKGILASNPNAAVIIECRDSIKPYSEIAHLLAEKTVIIITNSEEIALKFELEDIFEVVLESDPGWRLINVLSNAVERSALKEFLDCTVSSYNS